MNSPPKNKLIIIISSDTLHTIILYIIVFENGIILSGGGSEIYGLDIMMSKVFGISVTRANSPIDSVSKGLARINAFLPLKLRSDKNITSQLAKLFESKKGDGNTKAKKKKKTG